MPFLPSRFYLAIGAVVFIAYHGSQERPLSGQAITSAYGLKRRSLESVLQRLGKAGILASIQGKHGGYYVANPDQLTLADILGAVYGELIPAEEAFSEFSLLLDDYIRPGFQAFEQELANVTVAMLCEQARQRVIGMPSTEVLDFTI